MLERLASLQGDKGALYTVNRQYLGLQPVEEERKGFGPEHHLQHTASSLLPEIPSRSNSTCLTC